MDFENIVNDDSVREGLAVLVEELSNALVYYPHDEFGIVRVSDRISRVNGEAPGSCRGV